MSSKETVILGKKRPCVHFNDRVIRTFVDDLENGLKDYGDRHELRILTADSVDIGFIDLIRYFESDNNSLVRRRSVSAQIMKIELHEDYRGRGFGKSSYLELLKYLGDIPLESGDLNENSEKIWESLVRDGLAEKDYAEIAGALRHVGYVSLPEACKRLLG